MTFTAALDSSQHQRLEDEVGNQKNGPNNVEGSSLKTR